MAEKMKWEEIVRHWKRGWVLVRDCEVAADEVVAGTVEAHAHNHQDLLLPLDRLKDPTAGIFPVQRKRPRAVNAKATAQSS